LIVLLRFNKIHCFNSHGRKQGKNMRILCVFGTRPEAIKFIPVIKELNARNIDTIICDTGQHKEMTEQVLDLAGIKPDINLEIMQPNQTLTQVTLAMLEKMDTVLDEYNPDCVLVLGDTNTAFAATLAAYYKKIAVGHIEAGLRSGDIYAPFPEEVNRRMASTIAKFHFAPTEDAKSNLIKENISDNIYVTGNTVVDALLYFRDKLYNDANLLNEIETALPFFNTDKKTILVTAHRRENFGDGFKNICDALLEIANRDDTQIVLPVHPNPNVKNIVEEKLGNTPNIHLIPPQHYLPFIYMMDKSYLIMTDSGGIQEEAPTLGRPIIVMRKNTERPEGVDAGTAILVGTNREKIVSSVFELLDNENSYNKMSKAHNPYGDGNAASKIVKILQNSIAN